MAMVEMVVNMDCHGCERKVRKALLNIDGVESIDIDMNLQKVTVIGMVDQENVLEKVRRTGKKAELWPFPNNPEMIGFTQAYAEMYGFQSDPTSYFHGQQQDVSAKNYYQEWSSSSLAGVGERASIAFSDENVNACSIL